MFTLIIHIFLFIQIRYANFKNAKGAMIWSLETDDFTGKNSPYPYPLLVTINQVKKKCCRKKSLSLYLV